MATFAGVAITTCYHFVNVFTATSFRLPELPLALVNVAGSGRQPALARQAPTGSVQVPELLGIAHHVDRRDLAVLDLERGGLQLAVGLAGDEARQAVDEGGANQRRAAALRNSAPASRGP